MIQVRVKAGLEPGTSQVGATNEPDFVRHVAGEIARLKGVPAEEVGEDTSRNVLRLFSSASR